MVTGLNNINYKGIYNDKESFFYIYTGNDNLNYVGIHNDKSLEPFNKVIEEAKRMQKSEILNKDKTIFYKKGAEKYEVQQGGTGSQFKTGFDEKGPLRVLGELIEGLAVLEKASNNINNPYNAGYYIPYMKTLMKGLKTKKTSVNINNKKNIVDSLNNYITFYTSVITDPVFTSSLNRKKSIKKEAEATGDGSDGSNYVIARVKMDRVQADLLTVIFYLNQTAQYPNSFIIPVEDIFKNNVEEKKVVVGEQKIQIIENSNKLLEEIAKEYKDLFTNYKDEKKKLEDEMKLDDVKARYLKSQDFEKRLKDNHDRIMALHNYFNLSKDVTQLDTNNLKKLRVLPEEKGESVRKDIKNFTGKLNDIIDHKDAPMLPLNLKDIEKYP